ncbi:MAG: peptide MFS transporter [Oligoflexia bacterium]|nr:peptide MFS transporter [Oligoflexia bacterium]MBF0367439.1 peptide MFS transporter [Oligoflexia bacterium]
MANTVTATATTPATTATSKQGEIWGHPKGLYVLFFTEMWERFSYYGMRALLVYYMMKQLMFPQDKASQIYGLYTGFVYFTPFFGGLLADRFLGQRRTVIIGGVLMAIGQFMLTVESLFYPALVLLIFGNGAFKPNISTQVGSLYAEGDPRRDGAFSIFYVGINLGAFFSPLICGTLGELYGWHYGFAAAGVGMVVGLLVYLWGQKYLANDQVTLRQQSKAQGNLQAEEKLTQEEKKALWALGVLCFFNILFWGVYEQQGNTLALWADAQTNRNLIGDWVMPASWFQSLNPMLIFILTPFVVGFWQWQSRRKSEPTSVTKMAIGCILLGLSFLLMIPAAMIVSQVGITSAWWLIGCIFVLTIGELYLSPVGLSLVTKVAPARMVSMMMGVWFLSSFFGNYMAGFLGTFWEKMSKESFFSLMIALAVGAGLLLFSLRHRLGSTLAVVSDVAANKFNNNNGNSKSKTTT